jgi:hypothetical protein
MKTLLKFKQIIILVILVVFALGACTKDFEEINTDPNNPTNVPAINIFTYATVDGVDDWLGGGWINHTYMACWSQQWCKVQYIDEDRYDFRIESVNGFFEDPYTSELMDLKVIIQKTGEGGAEENPPLNAAARIFKVWVFHQLVDVFGDVPYSEALQGNKIGATVFPKYDPQDSIYMDMMNELEESNNILANLSPSQLNFGDGDLFYGGDSKSWQKFGNSLYLRLLNRCHGAYTGADAKILQILSNPAQYPIMEQTSDMCALYYPGVLPYRNGTYNTLYTRTDQAISQTMVNWLLARNDPRLPIYAQPIVSDSLEGTWVPHPTYVGQQNGAASQPILAERSMLGTAVAYDPAAPLYLLTYDEVEFIKAEYYLRAGQNGPAQQAYEAAITASMERWGADIGSYLSDPLVDWNGGVDHQKLIMEQKWASIFGQGVEAYAEVRRTGYPSRIFEYELEKTKYPGLGLPVRLTYAQTEESYNGTNLATAKSNQGVQVANDGMFGTRLWWNTAAYPIPTATDPQGPGNW